MFFNDFYDSDVDNFILYQFIDLNLNLFELIIDSNILKFIK